MNKDRLEGTRLGRMLPISTELNGFKQEELSILDIRPLLTKGRVSPVLDYTQITRSTGSVNNEKDESLIQKIQGVINQSSNIRDKSTSDKYDTPGYSISKSTLDYNM